MPVDPISAGFTFVDARAFAQEVFEVFFTNWGLRLVSGDPNIALENLQYPQVPAAGIPDSVAAIALGPRSTIDRFWVSFFRQKAFGTTGLPSLFPDRTRRVSLGSPLVYPQAANTGGGIGTTNDPSSACLLGQLYLFPHAAGTPGTPPSAIVDPAVTTTLPTQYVSGVDGTTLLPFDNSVGNHENPYLHAYLYLKPMRFAPGPRFPMQRFSSQLVVAAGSPHCIGQLPVFGRSRIRLTYTSTSSTQISLGLLRGINEGSANNLEVIAATDTHTHGTLSIDNPCADYLNIYASPDADATVNYTMTALDDIGFS